MRDALIEHHFEELHQWYLNDSRTSSSSTDSVENETPRHAYDHGMDRNDCASDGILERIEYGSYMIPKKNQNFFKKRLAFSVEPC